MIITEEITKLHTMRNMYQLLATQADYMLREAMEAEKRKLEIPIEIKEALR